MAWCADFAPDGKTLALGHQNVGITFWDFAEAKLLRRIPGQKMQRITALAYSLDGKVLAAGSFYSKEVRLLDTASGVLLRSFPKEHESSRTVALSPDGRYLAADGSYFAAADQVLYLWEVATGKLIRRQPWKGSVAFSADGLLLISSNGPQLWEADTGKELANFADRWNTSWLQDMALSRDGRLLAVIAYDGAHLWDLASGKKLKSFSGHQGVMVAVAFSPKADHLVTGYMDGMALVWDLADIVPRPIPLTKEQAQLDWIALAGRDSLKAYQAFRRLHDYPQKTLDLLRTQLRSVPPSPRERMARLIKDLDHNDFNVREKASRELETIGLDAENQLREAVTQHLSPEVRHRLEKLVDTLEHGERSRRVRWAIKLLVNQKSAEARSLLKELAAGEPNSLQTREAKAALNRFKGPQ